ncbi:alpha amylase catalytic region [Halosimplex carlsbadense 2-9-1]|uniref:Alpha amylase catalytic region n=1 Tax=Halosimplex carlsbadense 2-9-1 TaxID=797114 RepID=M0CR42_9EURY|nr:alpha-amylase MalA [Halosimplex carlsbadense]ELZ24867.1 alpha amylase catalytic region [Halosimplex carlsbadense 2-9-1]
MHHPGPPRFVAVGDEVELAPRDPDPTATYAWTVAAAPAGSAAALGDDPVEYFHPDEPGRYVVALDAPDGRHELTVRAFPGGLAPTSEAPSYPQSGTTETTADEAAAGTSGDAGDGSGRTDEPDEAAADPDGGGRPRLTLSATVTDDAVVVEADPQPHPEGVETAADLEVAFLLDDRDDIDREDVRIAGGELTVPLDALSDRARVHAVAVGRHGYSVPDAVDIGCERGDATDSGRDGGTVTVHRPYDPPAWAEDSVIYEVYVRTFPGQGSDAAAEGEVFDAIRERLEYIEGLGVDTLWLTPVLANDDAPHGYNVTDFLSLAADLGTREDYERLIDAAHDRGMRVLFDLVCNHSARAHPYYQAAVSDPDSEYREWYEWRGPGEPETYFDWELIANFDFSHLPVRRHLLDAVDEWAPLVDGFRCDMAWAVPNAFWREVHDRLKARDADFLLLDETIPYIPDFQAGLFDVHFDSTTYAALRRVGNGEPAEAVLDAVEDRARSGFPDHAGFMLYAENHDETRYVVECGRPAAEAALGALCTLPGAPMVYAGQEFGQRGKRDDLAWGHADESLREHVRRLTALRGEQPALATAAALERVDYDLREGWDDRVVAFRRAVEAPMETAEEERSAVVVVLNFGADPATVAVDAAAGETDLLTGESVGEDDGLRVDSVAVLPAGPSGQRR